MSAADSERAPTLAATQAQIDRARAETLPAPSEGEMLPRGWSSVRCTLCGASRLANANGKPDACSLIGCPDPLHDCERERERALAETLVAPAGES